MSQQLIQRNIWLSRLLDFRDTGIIKVVTGIRRCGKSRLLDLYRQYLLEDGVPAENIISMDFELMEFDSIRDYRTFYTEVKKRFPEKGCVYLLLDEIQQVENWEKAVVSLNAEGRCDICISGSNAYLLSSEIATLLSGRYVEIRMLPLSFKEYLAFTAESGTSLSRDELFRAYLKFGGFPAVPFLPQKEETINEYLQGIYHTVVIKDILNRSPVQDSSLLERISRYLLRETGNFISPNKIAGSINSSTKGSSVKNETVSRYINALKSAYVVYEVHRFDLKGKAVLKTLSKYYAADTGIRNMLTGHSISDMGHVLETVVYLELLRRGGEIYVGKFEDGEIDFIFRKGEDIRYYQVSSSLADPAVLSREVKPLLSLPDNYQKFIITGDTVYAPDYQGIHVVNIIDFLLE